MRANKWVAAKGVEDHCRKGDEHDLAHLRGRVRDIGFEHDDHRQKAAGGAEKTCPLCDPRVVRHQVRGRVLLPDADP